MKRKRGQMPSFAERSGKRMGIGTYPARLSAAKQGRNIAGVVAVYKQAGRLAG